MHRKGELDCIDAWRYMDEIERQIGNDTIALRTSSLALDDLAWNDRSRSTIVDAYRKVYNISFDYG